MFIPRWWWKGIHPHVHTLLAVERDTPSCSHPAGGGKGYTLIFTPCWLWKGIHTHVHTLLVVERDTPSFSHPAGVERDTPSCSHTAGGGKGYTLTVFSHPVGVGKGYTVMFTPCWW
jgi:hypothetical protein